MDRKQRSRLRCISQDPDLLHMLTSGKAECDISPRPAAVVECCSGPVCLDESQRARIAQRSSGICHGQTLHVNCTKRVIALVMLGCLLACAARRFQGQTWTSVLEKECRKEVVLHKKNHTVLPKGGSKCTRSLLTFVCPTTTFLHIIQAYILAPLAFRLFTSSSEEV